jgi:hypothetical protein
VRAVRQQIAFHAGAPAYRPVLGLHSWSDLGVEVNAM